MSEEIGKTIGWTVNLEQYFADTGEKSHCLAWCHKKAETLYSYRRTFIDLPVIIISAVTGFMSAGSQMMFNDPNISSIALGVASLFVSVLNTAGGYFGWSKRAEGHRIAAIQYSKLYRFLTIELSLPRDERMNPHDLLKMTKESYDRLQEISPLVPPEVLAEFKKKFDNEKEISKPEEANGLHKITVYQERERSLEKSFGSPVASFQENPLLLRQTSVGLPLESHLKETTKASSGIVLRSPHIDLPTLPPPVQHQPSEA
jgi:hypothetical protein